MSKKKRILSALLSLALAVVLSACAGPAQPSGQNQNPSDPPAQSGENEEVMVFAASRYACPGKDDAYYCSSALGVWESLIATGPGDKPTGVLAVRPLELEAVFQGDQPVPARDSMIIALDRRGCRAQQQQRTVVPAAQLGHLPRMVPGRALGTVGVFLLLVHHDQPDPVQRGEDRRPGTDDNRGIPILGPFPAV